MDWLEIKPLLVQGAFDLSITGAFGKSKTVNLTMVSGALTFTTLGTGSMKRVVRVVGEPWVLALAGDSQAAAADILGEVTTLCTLASNGIRTPKPFKTGTPDTIIFNMTVYNEDIGASKVYPAFLQEFLPFTEMEKLVAKEKFALNKILFGGVPMNIQTTVDDLKKIKDYFVRFGHWGDFQVMYDRGTGHVYVFDPLPVNQSGEDFTKLVNRWLDDIEIARELQRRKTQPPLLRRNSF